MNDTVLCSGTLGSIPFADKIAAAAAAGFGGVSIYFRECDQPGQPEQVRTLLDDTGLFLAELDGPMDWLPAWDGPAAPAPAAVVDRAVALGARSITVIEVTGRTPPLDLAVASFAAVCDLAMQAGVLVHIEPFAWSGIREFSFAASIVRDAGRTNGGLILDTWHLFRGPDHGVLPGTVDPRSILGLQINDVRQKPGSSLPRESLHDRCLPGAGAAADGIRTLLADLRRGGCLAPLGVEVFSDELQALPARETARLAYESLAALTA